MLLTLKLRVRQLCLYLQELFNNKQQGSYKTTQSTFVWLKASSTDIHFTYSML
jgi:hypothetical protein